MTRLTIWLLQTGEPLHIDDGSPRPMRAMNLSNALVEAGHRVVLWSAAFNHQTKRQRSRNFECITLSENLELRLIPSPGYHRNIGMGRLWDHAILARNLRTALGREVKLPDVAFIGYPPIETAVVMSKYLKSKNIPTILDIKDQWPSLFIDHLPRLIRPLGRLVLFPYYSLAKQVMLNATCISTMAEAFLQWSLSFAGRSRNLYDQVFPLTSPQGTCSEHDLDIARHWWDKQGITDDSSITRIIFVGSHMSVFDFQPVKEAAVYCAEQSASVEFVICGDGGSAKELRELMANLPNVYFPGWIDRPKIETLAQRSHAALAPYQNIDNFTKNLPNKVIDSLALGLPILSPLHGEVANLITQYRVGLRYGTVVSKSLYECIEMLTNQPQLQGELSQNARNLYREKFDYEMIYTKMVSHLEQLVSNYH